MCLTDFPEWHKREGASATDVYLRLVSRVVAVSPDCAEDCDIPESDILLLAASLRVLTRRNWRKRPVSFSLLTPYAC